MNRRKPGKTGLVRHHVAHPGNAPAHQRAAFHTFTGCRASVTMVLRPTVSTMTSAQIKTGPPGPRFQASASPLLRQLLVAHAVRLAGRIAEALLAVGFVLGVVA